LKVDVNAAPGFQWWQIENVLAGSAAAKAGLIAGDAIRFPELNGVWFARHPGEQVKLDVRRGGRKFQVMMVAQAPPPVDASTKSVAIALLAQSLVTDLFCLLLLIKGWHNRSALLLSTMLLTYAFVLPSGLFSRPLASVLLLLNHPIVAVIAGIWPIFCLEVSGGPSRRLSKRLVYVISAAMFLAYLYWRIAFFMAAPLPGRGSALVILVAVASQGFGYLILAINYRRDDSAMQNRIKVVTLAGICLLLAALFSVLRDNLPGPLHGLPSAIGQTVVLYLALALFAYAVLKQRLFDLGFVINRTLVFGSVSFVLLASFGLAEWGVDRIVPESWHEGSMVISAAIAVGLFLSFHRLRDWIEHQIERLFFSSWQKAEAGLRRFVESAGHFEQVPALCRGFHDALGRFAPGTGAAIYLRGAGGAYRLERGVLQGAPEAYAEDQPAFALMRAERRPIELAQTDGALPGELALPMLDQGTLIGFVLVGSKADGTQFRPDEVHNLGWAAHQVGLDLRALHARLLESENLRLRDRVALLEEERTRPAIA